jgi:CheY-like chemotaxis protein
MANILIVDDDPTVGLTFSRILEQDGHRVARAETAAEGLTRVAGSPPDAVILDMRMPLMSGLDFMRRLRGDQACRDLPVGIVTGDYFLKEEVLAELSDLGATICYKPVWMDDLQALTRSLLDGTARSSAAPAV